MFTVMIMQYGFISITYLETTSLMHAYITCIIYDFEFNLERNFLNPFVSVVVTEFK